MFGRWRFVPGLGAISGGRFFYRMAAGETCEVSSDESMISSKLVYLYANEGESNFFLVRSDSSFMLEA